MQYIKKFPEYYLRGQVVKKLGVSALTVVHWVESGRLHCTMDEQSRKRLFDKKEIDALADMMKLQKDL